MKQFYTITELAAEQNITVHEIIHMATQEVLTLSIRFKNGYFVTNDCKHWDDWIDCRYISKIIDIPPYHAELLYDHFWYVKDALKYGGVVVEEGTRWQHFMSLETDPSLVGFWLMEGKLEDGIKGCFRYILKEHMKTSWHSKGYPAWIDKNGKSLGDGTFIYIEDLLIRAAEVDRVKGKQTPLAAQQDDRKEDVPYVAIGWKKKPKRKDGLMYIEDATGMSQETVRKYAEIIDKNFLNDRRRQTDSGKMAIHLTEIDINRIKIAQKNH